MTFTAHVLDVLPGTFAICQLPGDAPLPGWCDLLPLCSISRTQDELSIICGADVVVMENGSLDICEVIARGQRMVVDGRTVVRERFLEKSSRKYELHGDQMPERLATPSN